MLYRIDIPFLSRYNDSNCGFTMSLNRAQFLESFSKTLQTCRSFHNFSITDLALRSGIHRNSISSIENQNHDASSITCARLCFALNVQKIEISKDSAITLHPKPLADSRQEPASIPYNAHIMERAGKAICARRESCGLSQEELAVSAGIHKNTLWAIERGLTVPSNYNLFSIYYSLGVRLLEADVFDIVLQ